MIKFSKIGLMLIALMAIIMVSCDSNSTDPLSTTTSVTSINKFAGVAGDTITINGTGFGTATDTGYVSFGGILAPKANYPVWTNTQIKVIVPAGVPAEWTYLQVMANSKLSDKLDFYYGMNTLEATSLSNTSIRIFFNAPKMMMTNTAFEHYMYTIRTQTGSAIVNDKEVMIDTNGYFDVSKLVEGEIYTFELSAMYKDGVKTTPLTVKWSPASRFTTTSNGIKMKLYESASKNGSGLDFYDETTMNSEVLNVASGSKWNLGLDTKDPNQVKLSCASAIKYSFTVPPQSAEISTTYYEASNFDLVRDSKALDDVSNKFVSDGAFLISDLEKVANGNCIIFIARTKEPGKINYNYAKVLVVNTPGVGILKGTSPDRYIEVEVSYQKIEKVPYAKR